MKIAVIAANGRSGQVFVERALAAGHEVRGGVLGHGYLPEHNRLTLIHCDATQPDDLHKLFTDQDAVVSLIGHTRDSLPGVRTKAMQKAVAVMDELGLMRLVSREEVAADILEVLEQRSFIKQPPIISPE